MFVGVCERYVLKGGEGCFYIASPFPRLVQRYSERTSRRFAGDISRECEWPFIWARVEIMTFRKLRWEGG